MKEENEIEDEFIKQMRTQLKDELEEIRGALSDIVSDYNDLKEDLLFKRLYMALQIINLPYDEFVDLEEALTINENEYNNL